jgi:CRP-like cAMP-binding protein
MIANGSAETHKECCRAFTYEQHPAGEFLFQAGEEGSKFYVIISGSVGVLAPVKRYKIVKPEYRQLALLRQGEYFGELALINYKPRAASIICREASHFAVLERDDYLRVLGQAHDQTLKGKLQLLLQNPAFSNWSKTALQSLSYFFRERQYKRSQTLYRTDEIPTEIFIVSKGEFQLTKRVNSEGPEGTHRLELDVTLVATGELLGAEEVLSGVVYQYTCVCRSTQGEVIYISREDFLGRVRRNEETIKHFHSMNQVKEEYRLKRIQKMTEFAEITRNDRLKGHHGKAHLHEGTNSKDMALIKAALVRDKANRAFFPGIVVPTARLSLDTGFKKANSMIFPSRGRVTHSDFTLSHTHACAFIPKKHPNWADIATRKYAIDRNMLIIDRKQRAEVVNYHRQAQRDRNTAVSADLQRHSDLTQARPSFGLSTINLSLEHDSKARFSDLA